MSYELKKQKILKNIILGYYKTYKLKKYSKLYNKLDKKEKKSFNNNYAYYKNTYLNNKNNLKKESQPFELKLWSDYTNKIEKYFLDNFDVNFLSNEVITQTMFIRPKWQNQQIKYLKKHLSREKLKKILKEKQIGQPLISNQEFDASANSIHHLNHLIKFKEKTNFNFENTKNIVEWGAGYGNMVKLLARINQNLTYTLIDLPIFSFIQGVYLSNLFGKEKINIILNKNQSIINNKINIIPVNNKILLNITHPNYDIFISTWALSESNEYSQKFVKNLNYFNSKYLLIAHQGKSDNLPFANNIQNNLNNYKIIYHNKIPYIRGENKYLFAKL